MGGRAVVYAPAAGVAHGGETGRAMLARSRRFAGAFVFGRRRRPEAADGAGGLAEEQYPASAGRAP